MKFEISLKIIFGMGLYMDIVSRGMVLKLNIGIFSRLCF